jgi:hypothetical protein
MFSILKKKAKQIIVTKPITVAEIHNTFYTEVDRLLQFAQDQKEVEVKDKDLRQKADRLRKLGFISTKEVKKDSKNKHKEDSDLRKLEEKRYLVETINYFSMKYPHYKFITEDSVKKLCEKYNLVYSTVDRYIGEVPDINLEHIEKFKIDESDSCFEQEWRPGNFYYLPGSKIMLDTPFERMNFTRYITKSDYNHITRGQKYEIDFFEHEKRFSYSKSMLEIAAPLKDFQLDDTEVRNFKIKPKIEIKDPIVLQPVCYNEKKYYLIVTAWGDEALDELVLNERMN